MHPYRSVFPRQHVLAHRMKITGYPENTILSLKEATKRGVDWVEFDVKVIADGTLVSMHDTSVDRTTDGTGDITKMTIKEVKGLNAGKGYPFGFVPVPTVEEIIQELASCGKLIRAEMHIHNLWEPESLVAMLDKYHARDRCYFNLNAAIMGEYMRVDLDDKDSLISLNIQGDTPELKTLCLDYDLSYLCVSAGVLNRDFVKRIHEFREQDPVFVHCYPVQGESDWHKMLDMGVDVIQTDYPEALMEYMAECGFNKV